MQHNNRFLKLIFLFSALFLLTETFFSVQEKETKKSKSEQTKNNHTKNNFTNVEEEAFYNTTLKKAQDSLLITNGFFDKKYDDLESLNQYYRILDSLENRLNERPQLKKLKCSLKLAADTIINKYALEIEHTLQSKGIFVSKEYIFDIITNANYYIYNEIYTDKVYTESHDFNNQLLSSFDTFFSILFNDCENNWKKLDNATCSDLKIKISQIYKNMERDLNNCKITIAKAFEDYYPALNNKNIPDKFNVKQLKTDNYTKTACSVLGDIIISRTAEIYADDMPCDFFDDENAIYDFKKDEKDIIHIYKKSDSIQMHFTYNAHKLWDTILCYKKSHNNKIYFEGYSTYISGSGYMPCIAIDEILYEKTAIKTDTIPDYTKTESRYEHMENLINQKERKIKQRYDSIFLPAHKKAKEIADRCFTEKYHHKHK